MLNKTIVLLWLLISFAFLHQYANADQQVLFRHLDTTDGLAQNSVRDIHQDRHGYMWFATENGLSRYDGYTFRNYFFDPSSDEGLSHQTVQVILEDRDDFLWFGTGKGLNRFNPKTEEFKHYFAGNGPESIAGNDIQALAEIGDELWVGTFTGVSVIDLNNGTTRTIEVDGSTDREVWSIAEDDDGGIWLGAMSGGVWHRKAGQHQWQGYWLTENPYAYANSVKRMIIDGDTVWLGTMRWLAKLTRSTGDIERININQGKNLNIFDLLINDGQLWLTSYGHGLFRYDLASAEIVRFTENTYDPYAISSNYLTELYRDSQNRLWLGSFAGGVDYDKLDSSVFLYRHIPGDQNSLSSDNVSSVLEANNQLIFATNSGVSIYDRDTDQYHHHKLDRIITLYASPFGEIWASGQRGVYKLSNAGAEHIKKINREYIVALLQLDPETLLVGTLDGLWLWDKATETFQNVKLTRTIEKSFSKTAAVEYLMRRANGDVLIGTQVGISQLSINDYKVKPGTGALQQLQDKHITYIFEDKNRHLWVGTNSNGLYKLSETDIVAQYSRINGMPDNAIRGIAESNGYLWVSTDRGIVSIKESEQHKGKVVRYRQRFLTEEFNSGAVFQMSDGQLLFGGVFGAVQFSPKDVIRITESLPLKITDIKLFNQSLAGDSDTLSILDGIYKQLTLQHDQNIFSLEFSAFDYDQQGLIYAYRLNGVRGADWITTDENNRRVTFTDLSAGDYLFEVKAGLSELEWSDQTTSMKIIILPPWWQTNIAYISYAVILILSIMWIIKARTNRLYKQSIILKQKVAEQTEKIRGLLEKKNEIFANVSHELRTPLTLILGPVDAILRGKQDSASKNNLQLIRRSGQRLQALVEQLLLFSKLSHFESLEAKSCSVKNIIQVMKASMKSLFDEKQLTLETDEIPDLWVKLTPEDALQTILINLLSNATKYTPKFGKIKLMVKLTDDAHVQIIVKDSGPGIPEDWQEKIFERFSRLPQHAESNISGTGLGLPIVKDLVEINDGCISVSNAKDGGAIFTVILPRYSPTQEELEGKPTVITHPQKSVKWDSPVAVDTWQNQEQDTEKPILLIIDDTADMRSYLASELSYEFNILLAENGETGLQLIQEHGPDLVVCDVMMPGIDGFEVLKRLRDDINISHTPLVLLTAKDGKENRMKGFEERADDYIVKPFVMDELKARIKNLLDLRKLLREQTQIALVSNAEDEHELVKNYSATEKRFLEKLKTALEKNYSNPDFDMEIICGKMHLSRSALNKKVKALLGLPPYQYLRIYRLQKAAQILKSGYKGNIAQLSDAMGFSTQQHFANSFKKHFGVSPKDYDKKSS